MRLRKLLATLAVVLLVGSAVAPGAIAAVTDDLNTAGHDEETTAPNPYKHIGTWSVAQHPMSEGTSDQAMTGYEDDSGTWIPGSETAYVVNTSWDMESGDGANPYSFIPGHIVEESYTEFPAKDGESWVNAADWTVTTGSSNVTISNTTVNADADAVQFDATGISGANSGDVIYEAYYDNWDSELDSDELKRVLQFGADWDTLQTDAEVQLRLKDESGSYIQFTANDSRSFMDNASVLANSTEDTVKQAKLSQFSVQGSDTTFDNIENVTVRVVATGSNVDTQFSVSWLDLRKKSKTVLGEERIDDDDSDSDWDNFNEIHNATGRISVHSMDTLDAEFDDATINDVEMPARYEAGSLDEAGEEGEYVIYWDDAQNPQFDATLNVTYALTLPSAVDLSHSNVELRMTQKWSESRYLTVETAEDVSDSTNLSQASYTSQASSLGSRGKELTLANSGINAGDRDLVHVELELTQDEKDNQVMASADGTPSDDGGMAPQQGDNQGFLGTIQGKVVALLGGVGVFAFLRRVM